MRTQVEGVHLRLQCSPIPLQEISTAVQIQAQRGKQRVSIYSRTSTQHTSVDKFNSPVLLAFYMFCVFWMHFQVHSVLSPPAALVLGFVRLSPPPRYETRRLSPPVLLAFSIFCVFWIALPGPFCAELAGGARAALRAFIPTPRDEFSSPALLAFSMFRVFWMHFQVHSVQSPPAALVLRFARLSLPPGHKTRRFKCPVSLCSCIGRQ
jgi:hypothetical protein